MSLHKLHMRAAADSAVQTAVKKIEDMDRVHFAMLKADDKRMAEFMEGLKSTVDEVTDTICNIRAKKGRKIDSVHDALSHLSDDRKELITTSLRNQTFVMSVGEKGGSQSLKITKDGKEFISSRGMSSSDASGYQIASIVIESVILVLNLVGISIPKSEKGLNMAIKIVLEELNANSIATRIQQLRLAQDQGDITGMATAILGLVMDLFSKGILLDIAGALLTEMGWFDWILTAAKLAGFVLAMIATAGVAEIVELVSSLMDAVEFIQKLNNMKAFD